MLVWKHVEKIPTINEKKFTLKYGKWSVNLDAEKESHA